MSSIYVLRHAQSLGNVNPSIYGTMFNHDIPLSKEGKEQSLKTAKLIQKNIHNTPINATAIFSSNYLRAIETAETISHILNRSINQNIFLAERQYGDQEGCTDVDEFNTRPMEKNAYNKAGHLTYTPIRGESLLDVQMRVALFVLQQNSFQFTPNVIIVSHASTCLMFHSYFTGEMPTINNKWENCEIRKYSSEQTRFTYQGQLN